VETLDTRVRFFYRVLGRRSERYRGYFFTSSRKSARKNKKVRATGETQELYNIFPDLHIPDEKFKLIAEIHNTIRGHFGVEKTIKNSKTEEITGNICANMYAFF